MTIVELVQKPTTSEEIKAGIVQLLEVVLAEAEAGHISTMLIIAVHPDSTWSRECSGTVEMAAMIGRLEITKQEWINDFAKQFMETQGQ